MTLEIPQVVLASKYPTSFDQETLAELMAHHRLGKLSYGDLANELSDGMLAFLLLELSDAEGCENLHTAIGRIDTVISDLEDLRDALVAVRNRPEEILRHCPAGASALEQADLLDRAKASARDEDEDEEKA